MFVLWLCIAAHPQLTKILTVYSQYETVARGAYTAWGLWFILHLVYNTLVLSVWFCLSEHRSNLIRSPTRSRSSPRLGPTGDFRFLWQSLPAARFTRLRHFSFGFVSPRLSLAVVTWGATEPRGKISFIFEKGMRFEQNLRSTARGRSGKMDLSEKDLRREFRGRFIWWWSLLQFGVVCLVSG